MPRYMVSDQVRALGSTLGTGGLRSVDIDHGWLREQYLRRQRSFVAIAAELGVSDSTVARLATTYGIPARPAGIASHPQMIRRLGRDAPRCVRAAVEGGLHGWQRLARFETAMTFPTLKAAPANAPANVDEFGVPRHWCVKAGPSQCDGADDARHRLVRELLADTFDHALWTGGFARGPQASRAKRTNTCVPWLIVLASWLWGAPEPG